MGGVTAATASPADLQFAWPVYSRYTPSAHGLFTRGSRLDISSRLQRRHDEADLAVLHAANHIGRHMS